MRAAHKFVAMLAAMAASLCLQHSSPGRAVERVITVSARRFQFEPNQLVLRRGEPVVLRLSTTDWAHGFNSPVLKLRADIMPGQTTELRFTPEQKGSFDFFCDIFCGSGHAQMRGEIIVN